MNLMYLIAFPAWLVIAITALARLHDMDRNQWAPIDHVYRIGLIGAGMGSIVAMAIPFSADAAQYIASTWRGPLIAWSWALIWIAKRDTVPWWDFILGVHRDGITWRNTHPARRLQLELRALRDSFTPRRNRRTGDQPGPGPGA